MRDPLPLIRDQYLKAQLAGDRSSALTLLDGALAQGTTAHELDVEVIAAAQREIGRLWQENRISVADEHMATAISQFALAHLYRFMVRAPRNARRVVVACVEGEQHELGPRIATDLLDAAGYGVNFLGANVPTDSLVAALRRESADLLALSASLEFNVPALRQAIARVRAGVNATLPIVVGGGLLSEPHGLGDGVYIAQGTARDFVTMVDQLLGVSR